MKLKLRKGLDIKLVGEVKDSGVIDVEPRIFAVIPDDYPGLTAKVVVREGDYVKVGSTLIHDKNFNDVCLTSPVSGTVKAVVRGDRRKVLRIEIESDGKMDRATFDLSLPVITTLSRSGLFARLRRRPFDVVPRPDVVPRDIFVTAFDSAPLATPLTYLLGDDASQCLAKAVGALAGLTSGKIYISVDSSWNLGDIAGAEMVEVCGPHPAGNAGIQAANIAPVNKGENIWTLDIVTLYYIGRLLTTGVLDTSTIVALTGPEVESPCLIRTTQCATVAPLIEGRLKSDARHRRIISGNVLTGTAVPADGFLRFPWRQITVIAEGDDVDEFMGWASLSPSKLSVSPTFPLSRFCRAFSPDAKLNGGRRAMIMSGEYDKVMPADIMVEYLLKAAISRNIEDMEALGIYEVAPEDVALCEFVDTSKLPVQQIIRDGLDFLRRETE